ncbi:DUF2589 domain-containing protein (plasmid) [Chromobacterium amazonense]|uniref:DUF2589 domain-containing protein n=1 Tax=Chromobacterium amazonense TaxID=1382803 RepID=UPI00237E34D3|nr:DUF2589 domain-containing protein [Chromobacterium amazonense]MDE1714218.1 DUF2589 domain-containing protein [Chromobacterium amazonense]
MTTGNEDNMQSVAQQFSGLPMKALIGGPLQAAVQAQHDLARTQTQILLDTSFSRVTDDNGNLTSYRPLTAAIELSTGQSGNGRASSALKLNLPVLTLLQLPALAIQSVDIAFDMEVKSSFERETDNQAASQQEGNATWDAKAGWGGAEVELKGTVSRSSSQTRQDKQDSSQSNNAHYHVEIKAMQQAMPEGIKLLLQVLGKNIEAQPIAPPPLSPPQADNP